VPEYRARGVEAPLGALLREAPALLLVGPRATGKTTTAARYVAAVARLDRPAEAAAFRADPDAALRGLDEPALLDEWQAVPEVLGAVKRAVDADPRPGRYLLTGSVRAELDTATWPGTGRLIRLSMYGMTVREQLGRLGPPPFLDRLDLDQDLAVPPNPPDLRGYVELALRSGFPEAALRLSDSGRIRWLDSYVDQVLTRDALQLESRRDPDRLRRYLEAYALNSAGVVEEQTLLEAAGINLKTAKAYEQLLTNLLIVEAVPSWTTNRLKRLIMSPKRYVVDAALVAAILRLDLNGVLRDGNILGRILDTFVAAQLRAELGITTTRPRLYHFRTKGGRQEVDLLAELGGQRVVGIEVKADSAPDREGARHLFWLREKLEDRFQAGVLFHTGQRTFTFGERIIAAPIATLWS